MFDVESRLGGKAGPVTQATSPEATRSTLSGHSVIISYGL